MSKPSNVREQIAHYERTAGRFDRSAWSLGTRDNRNHRLKVEAIFTALGVRDGLVLEVGVGTGFHARWMLDETAVRYVGLDASEGMIRVAESRLATHAGRYALGIADAHRLPFSSRTFDATFCSGTLHHLSDPGRGLAEIVRVTVPGGRIAIMEPNWKFPSMLFASATIKAERNAFKISPAALEAWGRAAGLEQIRVDRLLYTPPVPRAWSRLWDRVDSAVSRVPVLRRLSIMLLLSGRVPE